MWADIKKDILTLSGMDKEKQLFGAASHGYALGSLLTELKITWARDRHSKR